MRGIDIPALIEARRGRGLKPALASLPSEQCAGALTPKPAHIPARSVLPHEDHSATVLPGRREEVLKWFIQPCFPLVFGAAAKDASEVVPVETIKRDGNFSHQLAACK